MGKDSSGLAKAVKTDTDGQLRVRFVDSNMANDVASNIPVPLASQKRPDGANILLVTEASLPDGATAFPLVSGTSGIQGITAFATLRLVGFTITEDASTPAEARVRLHHGVNNTSPELFDIVLTPKQSIREWFDIGGIAVPNGVFIDRVTGTTRITLYARAVS